VIKSLAHKQAGQHENRNDRKEKHGRAATGQVLKVLGLFSAGQDFGHPLKTESQVTE